MAITAEEIEFTPHDLAPILARMDTLAAAGRGWINIGPGLTQEEFAALPTQSTVGKWISGRGPAVPMATWSPADGPGPVTIGISHGTGPKALDRLAADGLGLPPSWRKRQDHAKHGIVAEAPATTSPDDVLAWLLPAMAALSPRVAVGENWVAEVYEG